MAAASTDTTNVTASTNGTDVRDMYYNAALKPLNMVVSTVIEAPWC